MKLATCNELCASSDRWEDENLSLRDLIKLLVPAYLDDCMSNLMEFGNLASLTIYQCTEELVA